MWKVEPYGQKSLAKKEESSRDATRVGKKQWKTVSSWLVSSNIYSVLHPEKLENKSSCQSNTEGVKDVQHTLQPLREVWMKVGLEKLENHERVAVKALLDSRVTNRSIHGHKVYKIEGI